MPPQWRTKFDLDGYVPSLDSKARLIEACEAIERNEVVEEKESSNKKKKGKDAKAKSENPENNARKGEKKNKKFFCTEHGYKTLAIAPVIAGFLRTARLKATVPAVLLLLRQPHVVFRTKPFAKK